MAWFRRSLPNARSGRSDRCSTDGPGLVSSRLRVRRAQPTAKPTAERIVIAGLTRNLSTDGFGLVSTSSTDGQANGPTQD